MSEIEVHLKYISEGVDEIKGHLGTLNGRTRKVEATTAVHSWALGLGGAGALALVVWLLSKL